MKSKEIKIVRPYTAKVNATGVRLKYLQETFAYLKTIEKKFFHFIAALSGGMNNNLIKKFYADESEGKQDIFLAMLLFRVVPINMTTTSNYVSPNNIIKLYQKYTGLQPSKNVLYYLQSNLDTSIYAWQDCKALFNKMAKDVGLTQQELTDFLEAYISNGIFIGCDEKAARNAICQLFGEGKKSDTANKAQMCEITRKCLENSKTWEELKANILKDNHCSTANELASKYGTSNSTVVFLATAQETGLISDLLRKAKLTKLSQDIKKQSSKIPLPHILKIRNYILNGSTIPYNYEALVMPYRNVMADTNAKFSSNLNYVQQKANIQEEIEIKEKENPNLVKAVPIIGAWIQATPEENQYIPSAYHFGPLNELFGSLSNNQNILSAIDQFVEDNSDIFRKQPIKSLLIHIATHYKDLEAKDFLDASFVMKMSERYNKLCSHPYVMGNNPYTWGPQSAISGSVTHPLQELGKSGILAGKNPTMWVTAELLDNGKWIEHHLPFGNSRYYEEVYYTDPNLPTKPNARIPKYGFRLLTELTGEVKKEIAAKPEREKAAKTVARIQTHSTYNVQWDETTSFNIREVDGEFYITVNHRHKSTPCKTLQIGDRILGFDQNQTAATAYCILELSKEGSDTILYKNKHYKFISSGKIVHNIKSKGNTINQLEYLGLPNSNDTKQQKYFNDYKGRCKTFIKSLNDEELYKQFMDRTNTKSNMIPFFEAYSGLLMDAMKKHGPKRVRNELKRFLLEEAKNPLSYGSLSMMSIRAIRKANAALNTYFSLSLAKMTPSGNRISPNEEDKQKFDMTLYNLQEAIHKKIVNKRKERVRVQSSEIIRLCVENNVKLVLGEGGLPIAESKTNKKQNATRMDWCARVMAEYVYWGTQVMGIQYQSADSEYTSHQNPLVHIPKINVDMRPRYDMLNTKDIKPYHVDNLKKYARSKKTTGTAVYYRTAAQAFCEQYNINLANLKYPSDLAKYTGQGILLIPKKGGRFYISTHPITTHAKPYNNQYICDADEIAACNIIAGSL